jgi:hypothetical protein
MLRSLTPAARQPSSLPLVGSAMAGGVTGLLLGLFVAARVRVS